MTNVNHGRPTSIRIPENTKTISESNDTDEEIVSEISQGYQLDNNVLVTIMSQSFEYTFPPITGWEIKDTNNSDGKEIYWDDDSLRPFSGYWGAWPARGGADGINPTIDTDYPAIMDTWVVYGPFDLSYAKSAELTFQLWRDIEEIYDWISCGFSEDGNTFYGTGWDGNVGWETETLSLDSYMGDSYVWIAWYFHSDASVQFKCPWIDDITLKFVPGDITIQGNFTYADRLSTMRGANGIKVQLWDQDIIGDNDLLVEMIVSEDSGHYSFPTMVNWDTDDTDPILGNRRLDLYVLWVLENDHYKVTNSNGNPYAWISSTHYNINMGNTTISGSLPPLWINYPAMWIFQDIRRAREYYLNHTNPQSDPGFLTAHWEENQNSENGIQGSHFWALINPHVYIAQNSLISVDTIVHELGHHVMWNKTGQWLWYEFNCFDHDIFSQESIQCAWSEGWADFFAIAVNGDICYDKDVGPCTGVPDQDKYDLENHTRNDPNALGSWWGDGVEGRVAGTLYDLMDSANESPWYDNSSWGFDPIVDIALVGSGRSSLQ